MDTKDRVYQYQQSYHQNNMPARQINLPIPPGLRFLRFLPRFVYKHHALHINTTATWGDCGWLLHCQSMVQVAMTTDCQGKSKFFLPQAPSQEGGASTSMTTMHTAGGLQSRHPCRMVSGNFPSLQPSRCEEKSVQMALRIVNKRYTEFQTARRNH